VTATTQQTQRTLWLGIIGTGLAIEKLHWPALQQMTEGFQVTAFADIASTPWRQAPHYRGGPQLDAGVHHIASAPRQPQA